jgi:hypothetical protein
VGVLVVVKALLLELLAQAGLVARAQQVWFQSRFGMGN